MFAAVVVAITLVSSSSIVRTKVQGVNVYLRSARVLGTVGFGLVTGLLSAGWMSGTECTASWSLMVSTCFRSLRYSGKLPLVNIM